MQKRWVEQEPGNTEVVTELQQLLNIDEVLATLLVNRGICTFESARDFFRPEIGHLHDPFLMKDMDRAVQRIERAILLQEKVLVYGDYDVDGTTAVSVVYSFFKRFHDEIDFYIPDRYKEGYGVSTQGIDYASRNGFSLIIALDCGIKSVDKVNYAHSLGIDFIICDHHLPGDVLPAAAAVLDPKRGDCAYPYKELSGCGIGFKLIQAFSIRKALPFKEIVQFLDLVAVSIAADIVPITGENRVLTFHGLKRLNSEPCKGLSALMDVSGKKNTYTITDVVFSLAPRINAAGRIDDARHAVNLLVAEDHELALSKGMLIDLKNTERKEHDSSITEQALLMIEQDSSLITRKTTVVYDESWHKGVIGIVASRLIERYYRPTVVLTRSNGHVAGSARSVAGFDLYQALDSCSDLLDQFGGHKYAAGLTMKPENIPAFQDRFEQVVSASIAEDLLVQQINIEACIPLSHITPRFVRILSQFAPFGPQNLAPVFLTRGVRVYGQATVVGGKHLKLVVRQDDQTLFNCIAFGMADFESRVNTGLPFDICYTIEENIWKEKRTLQLNVKGIRA